MHPPTKPSAPQGTHGPSWPPLLQYAYCTILIQLELFLCDHSQCGVHQGNCWDVQMQWLQPRHPQSCFTEEFQPKLQSVWVHLQCTQLHHKVFARVTLQKHHTQKCLLVAHAMMASNCACHAVQYNTRPCKHGIFERALRHPGQPIEGGC